MMAFANTKPDTQPAEEHDNDGHGKRYTHPAFAQIVASRSHGGHQALYGSDFMHSGVVTITIKRSELVRNLSHDWYSGAAELISVDLSESQWATFVSAMNIGDGVPCTLNRIQGERMPGVELEQRTAQFNTEIGETLADAIKEIDEALELLPKGGKAAEKLRHARMEMVANLPFVAKSFASHMERHVEKAKTEIHGYMNQQIRAAGLEHLNAAPPLLLESDEEKS